MKFLETDFLFDEKIILKLEKTVDGDVLKNWLPAYHFKIFNKNNNEIGACDLRIGHNKNVYYGGNIGYGIYEDHRGNHYSANACKLLFKLAKLHNLNYLYITCNVKNIASKKICEYLGGELIECAILPLDNDMRKDGIEEVLIYKFYL